MNWSPQDKEIRFNNPCRNCLADFYHISRSGETLDVVRESSGWIVHTHLTDPDQDLDLFNA